MIVNNKTRDFSVSACRNTTADGTRTLNTRIHRSFVVSKNRDGQLFVLGS